MSIFTVHLTACNPTQWEQASGPMAVVVNTGLDLTWLPAEMLRSIGIQPRRRRMVRKANNEIVQREIGYAILRANGNETADEVVFGEPGDMAVLGARALEGFGVTMDDDTHFISLTTMMEFSSKHPPLKRAA